MKPALMLPYPMCCENEKPYGICRDCWEFNEAMNSVRLGEGYMQRPYPNTHLETEGKQMAVKTKLIHRVVTQSATRKAGIIADSRNDDTEVRVKWSEGGSVSAWLNILDFEISG
jgi:hypothetical protein